MTSLNKFFYEYEKLSADCYSLNSKKFLGSNEYNKQTMVDPSSLLLFESESNAELRTEFESVLGHLTNPFTKMRLWLKFELYELEAIFEAIQ